MSRYDYGIRQIICNHAGISSRRNTQANEQRKEEGTL